MDSHAEEISNKNFFSLPDKVERNKGKPVDGVDAIGEEDEASLVETTWALPCFKGVERCGDDEKEGKCEPSHEARVHTCRAS